MGEQDAHPVAAPLGARPGSFQCGGALCALSCGPGVRVGLVVMGLLSAGYWSSSGGVSMRAAWDQ